jgi:hypothetical protein
MKCTVDFFDKFDINNESRNFLEKQLEHLGNWDIWIMSENHKYELWTSALICKPVLRGKMTVNNESITLATLGHIKISSFKGNWLDVH